MPTDRDSSEQQPADGSETRAREWTASLSNSLQGVATSMSGVLANLNLVVSLSLLAAVVSFWLDFRGAYTATKGVLSPVAAALLPSVLVGLTVFVIVWCAVYGWRYVQSMKAKLLPDLQAKVGLKKLVPDIESCLFFLEEVGHTSERRHIRMGDISEIGLSLWEDLQTIGLDGPTAYSIQSALPYHDHGEPNVEELHRLLKALAPLARSGKVEEARRIY